MQECDEFPVSSWGLCIVFPVSGSQAFSFFVLRPHWLPVAGKANGVLWGFRIATASLFLSLGTMGHEERDSFKMERALGVEICMATALCHAAGGRALGAANAGIGAAVLRGRWVGGHWLPFGQTTRASGYREDLTKDTGNIEWNKQKQISTATIEWGDRTVKRKYDRKGIEDVCWGKDWLV